MFTFGLIAASGASADGTTSATFGSAASGSFTTFGGGDENQGDDNEGDDESCGSDSASTSSFSTSNESGDDENESGDDDNEGDGCGGDCSGEAKTSSLSTSNESGDDENGGDDCGGDCSGEAKTSSLSTSNESGDDENGGDDENEGDNCGGDTSGCAAAPAPSTATAGQESGDDENESGDDDGEGQGGKACSLTIAKSGDAVSHDGATEQFTYTVSSTGGVPVTVDKTTGVTDDKCSPVTYTSGDTNDDGKLDPAETWTFGCTYTVAEQADGDGEGSIVNTGTVKGTAPGDCGDDGDEGGDDERSVSTSTNGSSSCPPVDLTASDSWTTKIVHPALQVVKDGESAVTVGDTIHYTITITNSGDTALTVTPTDTACDGFDGSPFILESKEQKQLSCTHVAGANDGTYHNEACATGTDGFGGSTAKVCDSADTTVNAQTVAGTSTPGGSGTPGTAGDPGATPGDQLVLGVRITPGTARLLGTSGCAARAFNARIRGTKVASVVFTLDGKRVARLTKPNLGKLFSVRVNPAKLKLGVHRLVATVKFQKGTGTKTKTLRLSFQRCGKKLASPRFTG